MTRQVIKNNQDAEYLIRYTERELSYWKNRIAKEEAKPQPRLKYIESFQKYYDKNWNINIQAKQYLLN